ncbi:class I SAM-dependent methyltransferase [Mycobacterium simiae]|uniref:Class I SAM-dependent methyltransferase n=1 Tax=Mycobacterium simiae TaxID=1784 RepID=A0A5B1BTH4_MYCSI|nr:methyltransferase domain-containing protein [Mycobacterium simiae]KAA1251997.1 class I SAM-dependent methyltransferase [Mycobacterium simiae]
MSADKFKELIKQFDCPVVLEIGTRRVARTPSTVHRDWVPHAAKYIGSDFASGQDVDVVADVCELSTVFGEQSFDAIISCSVLEHIQYPWVAAVEMSRTLKVGGFMFVMTHQTFPLHAHPHDYYRFSKEGLETLFSPQIGLECIESAHNYRAPIMSNAPGRLRRAAAPSYLNSTILVKKVSHPPADFKWRAVSDA